jgi:hypothetical protein
LAKRICHAANARDTSAVGAVIADFKRRSNTTVVNAALELAVANQWLCFNGGTYTVTQAGADLGSQPRTGPRTRRLSPF